MKEKRYYIKIRLGSRSFYYLVRYQETLRYLCPYWERSEDPEYDITVIPEDQEAYGGLFPSLVTPAYREYKTLLFKTARELLSKGACIFHGVAFLWKGLAWIITAPSGTGKTTQYRLWDELYGFQIGLISGDMPVLEFSSDGRITVFPSPWNGKERLGSTRHNGPLGGIILLEQGRENTMVRMEPGNAVHPLFLEFASIPETKEEIYKVASMEESILRHVPVWKLVNRGDRESAILAHDTIMRYLGGSINVY